MIKKISEGRPSDEREGSLLKMKELMAATGVTKPTIIHYVNEGLLPEPIKTSRNMAYYHPSTVERIKLIKHLQSRYRLPLGEIKKVLQGHDQGVEIKSFIEMIEVVFGQSDPRMINKKEFCRETGLTAVEVDRGLAADLLIPREDGCFDSQDLAVGRLLKRALDVGLSLDDLGYYPRLAKMIVDQEMAIQERFIKARSYEESLAATISLTSGARTLRAYIIDRIFQRVAASKRGIFDQESDLSNQKKKRQVQKR